MKRLLLTAFGGLALCTSVQAGPDPLYQIDFGVSQVYSNNGVVGIPPVIDAVNFVNYGTFIVSTFIARPDPFATFDTLNYTNYGIMDGLPGWRFELQSNRTGRRYPAANFVNLNSGAIVAEDSAVSGILTGGACQDSSLDPSMLIVHATNIFNGAGVPGSGGSLIVGVNGLLDIVGQRVDLSYSGLEVSPIWNISVTSSRTSPRATFVPDAGIFDRYWAHGNFDDNRRLNSAGLWDGTTAASPGVNPPLAAPNGGPTSPLSVAGFQLFNPVSDSYIASDLIGVAITNAAGSNQVVTIRSNIVKGAVFVGLPSNSGAQIGFGAFPSVPNNNRARSFDATIFTTISNAVTGLQDTALVYVSDELASDTSLVGDGSGNSQNGVYCPNDINNITFRPANYTVSRSALGLGGSGLGTPPADFFLTSGSRLLNNDTNILFDRATNAIANAGSFAAYDAFLDDMASRPRLSPGTDITNIPGRVQISADVLNLDHVRVRGQGMVIIDTPHLVSSTNAVIDCENLNYDIGSTNGNLRVKSLIPPSVGRMRGDIRLWSATWSNTVLIIINNYTISNNVSTNDTGESFTNQIAVQTPFTNMLSVTFHTLMVDASSLAMVVPQVNVYQLRTRSANVVLDDNALVCQSLLIDGVSLTLNGGLTIPGAFPINPINQLPMAPGDPLADWRAPNAPNLFYLTNNGVFNIAGEGHFGDDRAAYYDFVNRGSISNAALLINSSYLENRGTMNASGPMFLRGDVGRLDGGSSRSGTISQLLFDELKLNAYSLISTGKLSLIITNALSDSGPSAANAFTLNDGVALPMKPLMGDLLGTTFRSVAPAVPSINIQHVWSADDRGPTSAGYVNNVAIGRLQLATLSPDPKFVFSGTTLHNGLYVDLLDLSGLGDDFLDHIQVNPSLTIYFAAVKLPTSFAVPANSNGIPQLPEEYLDGQLGGRLRWVQTYAGANSSQSGFNKALLNSMIIDSDQDGTPNGAESDINSIFNTGTIDVEVAGNGTVVPNLGGQPLIIGMPYTLVAQPADGSTFVGWDGPVISSSPDIMFTMQNGLDPFVATFTFKPISATYRGLFYESGGVKFGTSGFVGVTTTRRGGFSGSIRIAGDRFGFSGGFDDNGAADVDAGPYTVHLQAGTDHLTGTVTDGSTFTADLRADRAFFNGKKRKAPMAGRYTMAFPAGATDDASAPFGFGYGTVTLDSAGNVKLSGAMADGARVSQGTIISEDGQWPFYASLYGGGGQALGWLTFVGGQEISGVYSWIKETNPDAAFYPDGFNIQTNVLGSIYHRAMAPVTGFSSGDLTLSGGNLVQDVVNHILINNKNKITNLSTNRMNVTIQKKNGRFGGTVRDTETGRKITVNGVILQNQDFGAGFFRGTNVTGRVTLEP